MNRSAFKALLIQASPVFVGQLAVMANGIADSIMAGRAGSDVLAAVAIGNAVYISLYVGLMGVLLALTPLAAEHYGAKEFDAIGPWVGQSVWLAGLLSVIGMGIMLFPEPLLWLAQAPPETEYAVRGYLNGIAVGLPAALLFRVFYCVNQSISQPARVMRLQVLMFVLKVPLSAWFMYGGAGLHPQGAAGLAWATALSVWAVTALSWGLWFRQAVYKPYQIRSGGWRPDARRLKRLLLLGLPIGGSYLIEVTAFTFVAILVARLGNASVAGHQIVANWVATAYMVPLALSNATTVLAAQQLGAGNPAGARQFIRTGIATVLGCAIAVVACLGVFHNGLLRVYTQDADTIALAGTLVPWIMAYHLVDGLQAVCAFALRAYQVSAVPMLVHGISLWGIGLGGGVYLGLQRSPAMGTEGFWAAAALSLAVAAAAMAVLLSLQMKKGFSPR